MGLAKASLERRALLAQAGAEGIRVNGLSRTDQDSCRERHFRVRQILKYVAKRSASTQRHDRRVGSVAAF
jgi:enoyl-[acyl-carrier-protein] reductase (NADH)